MKKLQTIKKSAVLRKQTPLRPLTRNKTRWSSTYTMLERYLTIQQFIDTHDEDLEDMMLSKKEHKRVEELVTHLRNFDEVTKTLQEKTIDMLQVRTLFDHLIRVYPTVKEKLKADADIVHSVKFESGIVKILRNESLDPIEERLCSCFLKEDEEQPSKKDEVIVC